MSRFFISSIAVISILLLLGCGGGSSGVNGTEGTTAPLIPVISAPSGLQATAISTSQIILSWIDNSIGESGFKIERSEDSVNFKVIGAVLPDVVSFLDSKRLANRTYYYKVMAHSSSGNSAYSSIASARTFVVPWARSYGGNGIECANSIIRISDKSGYLVAGSSESFGAGEKEMWILKIDNEGAIDWEKAYGGTGSDAGCTICKLEYGEYIVGGHTSSFGPGGQNFWAIKLDKSGDILWEKAYGGDDYDMLNSIAPTDDNGFIAAGCTSSYGAGFQDFWIIKLDQTGEIEWQNAYGGQSTDDAYSIIQTSDGGYLAAGISYSFSAGYDSQALVLKLDSAGDVVWEYAYGGLGFDGVNSVIQTDDGDYAIAGFTSSSGTGCSDYWVLKLDKNGAIKWQTAYGGGGVGIFGGGNANTIAQTSDHGYIVGGLICPNAYTNDIWILKLDYKGAVIWEKAYDGLSHDCATDILQTEDDGYMVAGVKNTYLTSYDYWLLKLDKDGEIDFDPLSGADFRNTAAVVTKTQVLASPSYIVVTPSTSMVHISNAIVTVTGCTVVSQD